MPRGIQALLLILVVGACSHTEWQAQFATPTGYAGSAERGAFLKVHMYSGDLYVLGAWAVDRVHGLVVGEGLRYDEQRTVLSSGRQQIPLGDVALLETNRPRTVTHAGPIVLGVISGASLAVTAACIVDHKACFGSCPTFYAHDGTRQTLMAEGFSASFARVLEATDVDALRTAAPQGGSLELVMRNEALETHLVREVTLLAARRPPGQRVLRAGDRFFPVAAIAPPSSCRSGADDCLAAVRSPDGREYAPPTDPEDLGARQTIELRFAPTDGHAGLVLSGRNSLVSTFLFYQFLAYLGSSTGRWITALERDESSIAAVRAQGQALARIEVEVRGSSGEWLPAGIYDEAGPIARDLQVVPLPRNRASGPVRVRLRLTRGFWKLDQVGIARLGDPVAPIRITARTAMRHGSPDAEALERLRDPAAYLTTYPGDAYTLLFDVPPGDHELFLESRGYYYEWVREQRLDEESPIEAARFLLDTRGALRRLAPAYKRLEPHIDRIFWESRIGEVP